VESRYIIAVGASMDLIQSYLGFSSRVIKSATCRKGAVAMVEVDEIDCNWQSSRLASGLLGGRVYDSIKATTDRPYDSGGAENDYQFWACQE